MGFWSYLALALSPAHRDVFLGKLATNLWELGLLTVLFIGGYYAYKHTIAQDQDQEQGGHDEVGVE